MPCWCESYLLLLVAVVLGNAVVAARRREPLGSIALNIAGGAGLVLLVSAFWDASLADVLGVACVPILLLSLGADVWEANRVHEIVAAELRTSPDEVVDAKPTTWAVLLTSFLCMAPAYAMSGLLCLKRLGLS